MNPLLILAGVAGFLVVALGAFGAHGLEGRLDEQAKDWWETASAYGLVHAVAALAIALNDNAPKETSFARPPVPVRRTRARAGAAFLIGVLLFSGSLYLMALGAPRWLGMATPLGGVSFLIGWALIVIAGMRSRRP